MKKVYIIGSVNIDESITCNKFPLVGETVIGTSYIENIGGKGLNQAIACGRLIQPFFLTAINRNDNHIVSYLKKNNVNTKSIKKSNILTGKAIILNSNKDNMIVVMPNANHDLLISDVDGFLKAARKDDIVLISLEVPMNIVSYALKIAHEKGLVTVVNPAPSNRKIMEYLEYINILIPNETELLELANGSNIENAMNAINVDYLITTLGENGCAIKHNNKIDYYKARQVNAIDTTAAGDTFCGFLVALLACNKSVVEATRIANYAASITVTRKGASMSIPTKDDLQVII